MTPKLSDHGITKNQSADWQKLATIPADRFAVELEGDAAPPSTKKIIKSVFPKREVNPLSKLSPDARMLLGSIMEFERNGFLDRDPADLLRSMTPTCLKDMKRVIPRLIDWLWKLHAYEEE